MKNFLQLIKREFGLFWANSVLRMIFIGAPIAYGVLFGFVYQKGKVTDLNIIVVDEDNTAMSHRLIDMLNDTETLHVIEIKADNFNLKDDLIRYDGQAVVYIPRKFAADIYQSKSPEVNVYINIANVLTANFASRTIQVVLASLNAGIEMEALNKKGTPSVAVFDKFQAFNANYIRLYNRSSNYMSFLWPGMLATIVQQVILLALALSFASEFEKGTFSNTFLPRVKSPIDAILVKCIPFWIMTCGIWLFFIGLQYFFRVPLAAHNVIANLTLAALFIVAVSFMGILVSIVVPNQLKATEILMVVATPSFVISGFTWPLSQMPLWVTYLAKMIPLTHFLEGYRVLLMQDGNLYHIRPQLFGLTISCLVYGLLCVIALYYKMKKTVPIRSADTN